MGDAFSDTSSAGAGSGMIGSPACSATNGSEATCDSTTGAASGFIRTYTIDEARTAPNAKIMIDFDIAPPNQ
jgi:hypothetical protein